MSIDEPAASLSADAAKRVRAVLVRKWKAGPRSSADEALSPWVRLNEVTAATGLSPFEARRVLGELAAAKEILYERADPAGARPARWVYVVDKRKKLGLPAIPQSADDRPSPGRSRRAR